MSGCGADTAEHLRPRLCVCVSIQHMCFQTHTHTYTPTMQGKQLWVATMSRNSVHPLKVKPRTHQAILPFQRFWHLFRENNQYFISNNSVSLILILSSLFSFKPHLELLPDLEIDQDFYGPNEIHQRTVERPRKWCKQWEGWSVFAVPALWQWPGHQ